MSSKKKLQLPIFGAGLETIRENTRIETQAHCSNIRFIVSDSVKIASKDPVGTTLIQHT